MCLHVFIWVIIILGRYGWVTESTPTMRYTRYLRVYYNTHNPGNMQIIMRQNTQTDQYVRCYSSYCEDMQIIGKHINLIHRRIQGVCPPPLAQDVGFLTVGPKFDPLPLSDWTPPPAFSLNVPPLNNVNPPPVLWYLL